ncbi:CTK1 [Sanghuangporus sanghuang]
MHAAQARPRRHDRLDEEELFAVARGVERRPGPYHRSHHRAEAYGGSSAPQRSYGDSSHTRRSDDWRVADPVPASSVHDRYHDEAILHSRRDEYHDRPEGWNNRHGDHSQYSSGRRDWTKREDHGYSSSSYPENRLWGRSNKYDEPNRSVNGGENWYHDGTRHERGRGRYKRTFPALERDLRSRDDVLAGETSRGRRSPYWAEQTDEQPQWRREDIERGPDIESAVIPESDRTDFDTDRKWEPAASWKSRGKDDQKPARYERPDPLPPLSRTGKKSGKNKKKAQQAFHKRDSKKDDNMNNWQKRDFNPAQRSNDDGRPTFAKRRYEYSAESLPHSPAHSVYSYRSSNRSRSRSSSPKRRKRENEPHSRTIISTAAKSGNNRRERSPGWSPSSPPKPRRANEIRERTRRSSISSRSSSRTRSSSEPPDDRPKPKHRLPTATSIREIEIQAKSLRLSSNTKVPKAGNTSSAKAMHETEPELIVTRLDEVEGARGDLNEYESMPPPAMPASASVPGSANGVRPSAHNSSNVSVVVEAQSKSTKRNAGFKPIGMAQVSPAMKRFFPGEDDESESNTVQESLKEKRVTEPRLDQPRQSGTRNRRGSVTPSSSRSDKEGDMYNQREYHRAPSRNSEAVDRNEATQTRRLDQTRVRTPLNRQPASESRAYQRESATPTPKQGRPPSVNGDSHASREASRPPSRRSDLRNRMGVAPSPMEPSAEDALPTEQASEIPKDEIYAIVSQVGEGTFGKVYKARNNVTGVHVALKRIRMEAERDGFPVTAMREIKLLQSLRHINIVQLMEMMVHHGSVYMVFEYMDHDLTGVLSQTQFTFTDAHLKSLCQQMFQGLSYLHRKGVIHRDIKGSNILINNRGELKLADFGLARFYQKRRRADYTNRVITLWYRPPELLLGTTVYGPEVDMWSAGCIMLELFCKKPVFQGNDEIHQLDVIYKILGTPSTEEWPGLRDMPWYELVKPRETLRNRFRELFKRWLSPAALDLAERLLAYDPEQRATADQALGAAYFTHEEPRPTLPAGLASLEGEWHEFESKRERARKRRRVDPSNIADPSAQPTH